MKTITVRNVHRALPEGLRYLQDCGVECESRNGPVRVSAVPVTTWYTSPRERVVLWPERDANPFFHLFESLWMLAGWRDARWLDKFIRGFSTKFGEPGGDMHGAYGYRWRRHFDIEGGGNTALPDQLDTVINRLKADSDDRRVVIAMWDPAADLGADKRDLPCNTHIYPRIQAGQLDITVCCRSNDAILGCYGANAVHFSVLQEYLASSIGCEVGSYWQVSNNFHAYLETYEPLKHLTDQVDDGYTNRRCPYGRAEVKPYPIMSVDRRTWDEDLGIFMDQGPITGFREPFFRQVVTPLWYAHAAYKKRDYAGALEIVDQCQASDWRRAAREWLERRQRRFLAASDDGPAYSEGRPA